LLSSANLLGQSTPDSAPGQAHRARDTADRLPQRMPVDDFINDFGA